MPATRLEIGEEVGAKKTFVWVLEWPGWCRAGKDVTLAIDALIEHRDRYAIVATAAGLGLPDASADALDTVVSVTGGGGTDFGVPTTITDRDRDPVSAAEAERLASLVAASWTVLDRVAARSPEALRKGPRGGGRDRDKLIGHVDRGRSCLCPRDRHQAPDTLARGPRRRRRRAGRDGRALACAIRRVPARGPTVDAAVRGPPHRLARPRSRVGDGGSAHHGRLTVSRRWSSSARSRRSPRRSGPAAVRPAARSSRTDVAPSAFESFDPSGRRISGWWANVAGGQRPRHAPSRICAGGRVEQVAAADHEIDALAEVVDDDREAVRPVARDGRGSARSPPAPTSPVARADELVHPALRSAAERDAQDRTVQRPIAAAARAARPCPWRARDRLTSARTSAACSRSHRRGPRPRSRSSAVPVGASSSDWRTGPRSAHEPEPGEVLEQRGVVLGPASLPVVVLDRAAAPRRAAPAPSPTRRSRSRRARDGGSRSAPARTAVTDRGQPGSVGAVAPSARRRSRGLERARRDHQPPIEREQVGLRAADPRSPSITRSRTSRSRSASRIARRPRGLRPPDRARQLGALVEQRRPAAGRGRRSCGAGGAARRVSGGRAQARVVPEPSGDRLEREVIAARALPDDRLERDVVEVVDLPERLALGRVRQVDLDERPLDRRAARREGRRSCGSGHPRSRSRRRSRAAWSRSISAPSWFDWKKSTVETELAARAAIPSWISLERSRGRRSRARASRRG